MLTLSDPSPSIGLALYHLIHYIYTYHPSIVLIKTILLYIIRIPLQFATAGDILTMESEGAKMITAASENDMAAVKAFLAEGVDVNTPDWNDQTALIAAAGHGHLQMVQLLLDGHNADVNLSDKDEITAAMEAAIGGHLDVLTVLAAAGADTDAAATSGVTPLWLAASEGHGQVLAFLLEEATANASPVRSDGVTPLMVAATEGHKACVKLLLDSGVDVNAKDNDQLTALVSASEKGHDEIVQLLVQQNAETNLFSATEFSPLILASAHGHLGVVQVSRCNLLSHGSFACLLTPFYHFINTSILTLSCCFLYTYHPPPRTTGTRQRGCSG